MGLGSPFGISPHTGGRPPEPVTVLERLLQLAVRALQLPPQRVHHRRIRPAEAAGGAEGGKGG